MTLAKKLIIKILNLKSVILLEHQNIKTFLQKATSQIGLKELLWLKKLKALFRGHIVSDLKGEQIFPKKIAKKQIKKFRVEKVIITARNFQQFDWLQGVQLIIYFCVAKEIYALRISRITKCGK